MCDPSQRRTWPSLRRRRRTDEPYESKSRVRLVKPSTHSQSSSPRRRWRDKRRRTDYVLPSSMSICGESCHRPPLGLAASDPPAPTEAREEGHGTGKKDEEGSRPVATMQIRNPTDVWSTAQMAEEVRAAPHAIASGEAAKSLREQLDKLDDEELRIYLAAQRQLRHGDREQLIQRVLTTVSETSIREMLERRHHYFRSVEQILANDLRQLHMQGAVAPSPVAREKDTTLTGAEEETAAPELLHAPWGILRRPRRRRADPPMDRNADRLTQLALTEEELLLVYHRASTKDLDELPESLLRRYAYQFRLRWRRKQPNSLLEAVQWHAVTFLSVTEEGRLLRTQPSPTPAVRLQQEDEGMQKTLENFEAFRIISQRTNNLQVVDNKEINLRLKQIRREATKQDSRLEQDLRRERNLMAAASLASSAMAYTPPPAEDEDPTSHVLGWQQQQQETPPQLEEMPSELPPWELFSGEEEFRLDTGHFGDPTTGHYRELSDSKIAVLPSQESQKQWGVDDHLLPARLQEVVQEALLEQKRRHESIEKEYQEKLNYKRYKKWDKFLQKAQDKQKGRQEEEGAVRPLPAQKRMAQLLRQGSHKQKVSDALRAKFNKEL
ncbi:hypothetical protein AGDE_10488 [Angomonas deanei]|uniref:Uncharacterized protein n=1 Tax=Angomonas deanei TaxID=59799 RepID=A0A7G2CP85_9TRYP|nr:hypothetical protein AGDE_10488 [Angomonas deanei]CAD2220761.1 hypothetical protein, conserved [Angomonas deanei]|eukprot:EPY28225.1 hypothetical protein AGDE_10488 [Angomonas deanei]